MIPNSFVVRLAWSIVAGIVERTAIAEHGRSAAGEKSMRMLSGRLHWLTMGLALLVSAQGFTTRQSHGQAPTKPGSQGARRQADVRPASYIPQDGYEVMSAGMPGGMMGPSGPMSMSFPGPAPMDMEMLYGDAGCDSMGSCPMCGNGACGGYGCGPLAGRLGGGRRGGCACGGVGCNACGGGNGCLLNGRLMGLLGPLAPYSEGGTGAQRWFDFYGGTIGLARTSNVGGFSGAIDQNTGVPATGDVLSTQGIAGTPVLRASDIDLDRIRYGLELIAAIQVGVGSNIEARYFGLNNWNVNRTVRLQTPDLYSVFSNYGQDPFGGFDLDERFGFRSDGPLNNAFTFNQRRFANIDTHTRNQLTGFQMGGDVWVNVVPGIMIGVEGKSGIFGNHAEVLNTVNANSIVSAEEFLQDGRTAYVSEFTASAVYRLSYSWSVRASYNQLYVDNVALAPENFNTRDLSSALGGGAFGVDRFAFLNTDGEALYQGWSIGGEFLY